MPKKLRPTFTAAQHVILHKTARTVFDEKFATRGKQVAMAKALGLSQTSVSALLRGTYRPGEAVAAELAILAGYDDLKDLVGPYHAHPVSSHAPFAIGCDHAPEYSASYVGDSAHAPRPSNDRKPLKG